MGLYHNGDDSCLVESSYTRTISKFRIYIKCYDSDISWNVHLDEPLYLIIYGHDMGGRGGC